jgi:dTDP-4-dehydrorhamnose 3,5-epimerase-like enzyme
MTLIPLHPAGIDYQVFDLETIADPSGTLHVGELSARGTGPFDRFYFITGVPAGQRRGGHAHKEHSEYLICVQGSVTVHLERLGKRDVVILDDPGRALYLPRGYWRELIDFAPGTVLAVLASHPFSESDYIRDVEAFRRWENGEECNLSAM